MRRGHRAIVLALHPFTRGIAFAAFRSPLSPVDWGVAECRDIRQNAISVRVAVSLIERLAPGIVVLHDRSGPRDRPAPRIKRLQTLIETHARGNNLDLRLITTEQVRECFRETGAATRYEIALTIAGQIHEFAHRLPAHPKPWKTQSNRLSLFDAAALAMTHYRFSRAAHAAAEI